MFAIWFDEWRRDSRRRDGSLTVRHTFHYISHTILTMIHTSSYIIYTAYPTSVCRCCVFFCSSLIHQPGDGTPWHPRLSTIPTPKDFKDAIESLSVEQQQFAKATPSRRRGDFHGKNSIGWGNREWFSKESRHSPPKFLEPKNKQTKITLKKAYVSVILIFVNWIYICLPKQIGTVGILQKLEPLLRSLGVWRSWGRWAPKFPRTSSAEI